MAQVQFAVHVLHGFWRVNVFSFHTTNLFSRVHLLVGTSEGLRKNYATDFRETWMEGGSGFKMDLSIFELDSSLYLTF